LPIAVKLKAAFFDGIRELIAGARIELVSQ
jgi:hypothetical protein